MSDKIEFNLKIDKKKLWRNITLIIAILIVGALAYLLKRHEPTLAYSELLKVITGALVLIGIIYSIMTYELAQKKNRHDTYMQKISATYNAASNWFSRSMMESTKRVNDFQREPEFLLIKTDISAFNKFIDDPANSNIKMDILCLFNYFESIAVASMEEMMDDAFVKKYFRGVFIRYYNDYFPYIKHRRLHTQNPNILIGFTTVTEKWKTSQ